MPINAVRDRQGRSRFEFEFSRRVGGRRVRTRKLLPASWNRTRADAFDRQESARLYAQATGIEARTWLVDDAVARYLDERAPELKTGRGIAAELAALAPYWQGRPLDELHTVCAAISRDFRAVVAPATLMNRLRYLISACRWGWKRHRMGQHDPGAGIAMPAVRNERHVYPGRALMLQLARACPRRDVRGAIRVAFYSGMRRDEILRAVREDVFVLEDTKNGEPRLVPIHPKIRCCAGYEWPSKYVLGYWFRKARAAIGREDLHFHDLRHGTASALLAAGVDRRVVGKILGHKSAASSNRYEHLALAAAREALERIGARPTTKGTRMKAIEAIPARDAFYFEALRVADERGIDDAEAVEQMAAGLRERAFREQIQPYNAKKAELASLFTPPYVLVDGRIVPQEPEYPPVIEEGLRALDDIIESIRRSIWPTSSPSSPAASGVGRPVSPMEARAGVEPTYSDLQSRKRA